MTHTIGHNNPPSEIEILKENIANKYQDIVDSVAGIEGYKIPETIEDEEQSGRITDFIKSSKLVIKKIEEAHKETKAPFWECCKFVDNWKSQYEIKVSKIIKDAERPILVFLAKKAEEERLRQLAIAQAELEKANKLAEEARLHEDAGLNDVANELMNAAIKSESFAGRIAGGDFQKNAKTRSHSGSTASSSAKWVGEIISQQAIDLEVLRKYLKEEDLQRAVNAAIRDGVRSIAGVKIYQESKLNVR